MNALQRRLARLESRPIKRAGTTFDDSTPTAPELVPFRQWSLNQIEHLPDVQPVAADVFANPMFQSAAEQLTQWRAANLSVYL